MGILIYENTSEAFDTLCNHIQNFLIKQVNSKKNLQYQLEYFGT